MIKPAPRVAPPQHHHRALGEGTLQLPDEPLDDFRGSCDLFDRVAASQGLDELIRISHFTTTFGTEGSNMKHLVGVYYGKHLVREGLDYRTSIGKLPAWDTTNDPDELHGAVWSTLAEARPNSTEEFARIATALCSLDHLEERTEYFNQECIHAIGHGAFYVAATEGTHPLVPSYFKAACPAMRFQSVNVTASLVQRADKFCEMTFRPLQATWWPSVCHWGIYHSISQYMAPEAVTDWADPCLLSAFPQFCWVNMMSYHPVTQAFVTSRDFGRGLSPAQALQQSAPPSTKGNFACDFTRGRAEGKLCANALSVYLFLTYDAMQHGIPAGADVSALDVFSASLSCPYPQDEMNWLTFDFFFSWWASDLSEYSLASWCAKFVDTALEPEVNDERLVSCIDGSVFSMRFMWPAMLVHMSPPTVEEVHTFCGQVRRVGELSGGVNVSTTKAEAVCRDKVVQSFPVPLRT